MLNIRIIPDAKVAAIADPNETSRGWGADTCPDAALYHDARELIDDASIDALVVSTPNHTHAEILEVVFASEKPVLVEKPLCTTLADCRRVEKAAAAHPSTVWVGMEYRYMPPVARLVEEVRGGAIGRLVMLAIREHRFPFLKKVGDWNRFTRNTGGTLVEKCCHFFDLMNFIIEDRPLRVYASGAQDVNHLDESYDGEVPDILDNAYVVVEYAGGARAMLDLCMFADGSRHQQEIAVTGDTGKIECLLPESILVIGKREPRRVEEIPIALDADIEKAGFHHGATYFEHLAFLDAIRRGNPPEVSLADGLLAVAMGVAGQQSIEERRPVDLSELGL
jgi:predicted dehydrogenase